MTRDRTLDPKDPVASLEEGIELYDTEEVVQATLESDGIRLPRKPVNEHGEAMDVRIPINLASLPDDDLGDLLGQLSVMLDYLTGKFYFYKSSLDTAERKRKFVWARLFKEKTGSATVKENEIRVDTRYIEIDREVAVYTEVVALVDAARKARTQDYQAVSRLISLRESGTKRGNRSHNVNLPRGRSRLRS